MTQTTDEIYNAIDKLLISRDPSTNYEKVFESCLQYADCDPRFKNILGLLYEHGLAVDQNSEKAFQYYLEAAENEEPDSQNMLGLMLERGEGTKRDPEKALIWFEKSARNGNEVAQVKLQNRVK